MPRNRQSGIEELAALAQLFQGINAPQQRAQSDSQQAALAALGLMLQHQHQQSQEEFQQSQLAQQSKAEVDRSGEYWGGELPAKYAAQDIAAKDATATRELQAKSEADKAGQFWAGTYPLQQQELTQNAAHQKAIQGLEESKIKAQADAEKNALLRTTVSGFAGLPGMTEEHLGQRTADLGVPGGDSVVKSMGQEITNNHVGQLQQMLGPLLQNFNTKPRESQAVLEQILKFDPRMQSTSVQGSMYPWLDQQYQHMAPPGAAVPPPPSNDPALMNIYNLAQSRATVKAQQDAEAKKKSDAMNYIFHYGVPDNTKIPYIGGGY